MGFKITMNKLGFKLKKHAPEIMMVAGTVGVVTSTVLACKATRKLDSVIEPCKKDVEKIHEIAEHPEDYENAYSNQEEVNKDLMITYVKTGVEVAKLYALPVALGITSLSLMIGSNRVLKKRNIALGAAYATLDQTFKKYRQNVIDKFGTDIDRELRFGEKKVEVLDENGKPTGETATEANVDIYTDYARFFDECSTEWVKDADYNLWFLKGCQAQANDKLKSKGFLFLNDVYTMLGFEPTKAGQVVGWIYEPDDPSFNNYVDFGIYDGDTSQKRAFVNGYERSILLDFNVDGNIWDLMK